MKLRDYIKGLSSDEQAAYAMRCNTTVNYLTSHILYTTKEPSVRLMRTLAEQSGGHVSLAEVLEHYGLVVPERRAA